MSNLPFRFIHAADLHIELPVNGLTECPEHLEAAILDAPRFAAERLFRRAILEKVDFVVLSGDILAPQVTGPWAILFLIEQFKKLNDEGIQVYWAGGSVDSPDELPAAFLFPENVHFFPTEETGEFFYKREDLVVARLVGLSRGHQQIPFRPGEISVDPDGVYTIGVYHGKISLDSLRSDAVQYWALGGNHHREILSRSPVYAHYPGTTLARNQKETGDFGVSFVDVNEFGRTKVDLIKTSPIQWTTERIVIDEETTEEQILSEMRTRIKTIQETLKDVMLFVSWQMDAPEPMIEELRYGNLASSLLRDLRTDFGKEPPIVYSLDLKPILPEKTDTELFDQQTILGDYLRMIQFYFDHPETKLTLEPFFSEELQDYLQAKKRLRKRRLEHQKKEQNGDASFAESPEHENDDLPIFRPEIATLFELLQLSEEEIDEDSGQEKRDSKALSLREKLQKSRIQSLLEAKMTGIELLSADENTVNRKSNAPKKNPKLQWEMRNFLKNEGKENF